MSDVPCVDCPYGTREPTERTGRFSDLAFLNSLEFIKYLHEFLIGRYSARLAICFLIRRQPRGHTPLNVFSGQSDESLDIRASQRHVYGRVSRCALVEVSNLSGA